MIAVMIVPTGLGCEIGGHAGDATPAARLLGSACDKLVLHPNVVNASDINEMPSNALYVDGAILDTFLSGNCHLKEVKSNRILVVVNAPIDPITINAVSAARATLGIDASIVELEIPLRMIAKMQEDGSAGGEVTGVDELCEAVNCFEFDALAIASVIEVDEDVARDYLENGGVNPWGGVEAVASRMISHIVAKPVAHAPIESGQLKDFNEVVDPRMSAEMVSSAFLHCVLKGLHKAPRISSRGIHVRDVDALVSPYGCWGEPHITCRDRGIPIIAVRENTCVLDEKMPRCVHVVENYLEAAGLLLAMREGISRESVTRPMGRTITY